MNARSLFLVSVAFFATASLAREGLQDRFGSELFEARRAGKPLPQLSLAHPEATLREAYAVQKIYVSHSLADKETLAGFKGGVVAEGGQKAFGIDGPLGAVLFQSGWLKASDKPVLSASQVPDVGIETEIGFILAKTITAPLTSPEQARAAVRSIVPVIELPAGLRQALGKTTAADLTAVNVMSGYYIVGDPAEVDPDAVTVQLWHDGELVNDTNGAAAFRGQWWNLMFQINHALEQGYPVQAGQLIITGALGTIYKQTPGRYRATWSGMGAIEFTIE